MDQYFEDLLYIFFNCFILNRPKCSQLPGWFIYKWPVIQFTESFLTFLERLFLSKMKRYISKIFSVPYDFESRHVRYIRKQLSATKGKITQGMETSLLWLHSYKPRVSQSIQHSRVCVGWRSQGTMAFTVQAAMWETYLFMFSFMSFWGIKYSGSFLYSSATESVGNSRFLVPNTGQFFQKLWNPVTCLEFCHCDGGCFTSKSKRSKFSCRRRVRFQEVPRQSFAISPWKGEEKWDKTRVDGWHLHMGRASIPSMWKINVSSKALPTCLHQLEIQAW